MARIKTFIDGGNVLPSDLDAVEDDYECAFGTYKQIADNFVAWSNYNTTAGVAGLDNGTQLTNVHVNSGSVFYLDPALYSTDASTWSTNPRTVKLNLEAYLSMGTAAAASFSVGLYPATYSGGAWTAGTVVPGSSASFGTPGGNTFTRLLSSDFACPAAGTYCLGMNVSTTFSSGSGVTRARLHMRQI